MKDLCGERLDDAEKATAYAIAQFRRQDPDTIGKNLGEKRATRAEEAWQFLLDGVKKGDPMVAETYMDASAVKDGIMPAHAYTVVGAAERDGKRYVTLRNPAPYHPELDDPAVQQQFKDDPALTHLAKIVEGENVKLSELKYGTFEIPFETYRRHSAEVFRAPINP